MNIADELTEEQYFDIVCGIVGITLDWDTVMNDRDKDISPEDSAQTFLD